MLNETDCTFNPLKSFCKKKDFKDHWQKTD